MALYEVTETFYSLQGEGLHTGRPMFFIRLSGCNLQCDFCDTDYTHKQELTEYQLLELASKTPTNHILITGGEPLLQDLSPLVKLLKNSNYILHLETNASIYDPIVYKFDWVTTSPKSTDFDNRILLSSSEIKIICGIEGWKEIITEVKKISFCNRLLLLPLDTRSADPADIDWTTVALAFCLKNPHFSLCLQTHKLLKIR